MTALALHVGAALLIGYFGINAYTGDRGLMAKQHLDEAYAQLSDELEVLQAERADWQNRVALLKAATIDPDMLDERARAVLLYAHPQELTLMLDKP